MSVGDAAILVLAGENRCAAPARQVRGRVFGPLIDFGPAAPRRGRARGFTPLRPSLRATLSNRSSCPAGARFPRRKHFNPSSLDQSTCVPRRGSFYQGVIYPRAQNCHTRFRALGQSKVRFLTAVPCGWRFPQRVALWLFL